MNIDPIKLARLLVDLFYPLVEISLLDTEGAIQETFNAFSSLKEDRECAIGTVEIGKPFLELLSVGRSVRCLIYPIHRENKPEGYLRFRYDLTSFKNVQEQLNYLLQEKTFSTSPIDQWKESIDQMIAQYHAEKKINIQSTTAQQKRELISRLQKQGLFDFKESSAYVAAKLQISRATIYNYLKTTAHYEKIHVHQVDAFTNKRFGGNPAGVVLDAEELDETTMRKIARELNVSETAFVLQSGIGDFKLRYFTPTGHEVSFCGHSTVGALYMIAKEKRYGIGKVGKYKFAVETSCGVLKMEAEVDDQEEIRVAYEAPDIKLVESRISHEELAKACGFASDRIDRIFPVMYEKTNKDLFVVIRSLKDLEMIECDSKSLAQFSKKHEIVALCLLSQETFDPHNQFHMRCYAPLVGIPEDPFTGSVLGGLSAYVDTFGLLSKGMHTFRVEQGHFIERPGVVKVEFSKKKQHYFAKVFAQAVHCFSTEINLK